MGFSILDFRFSIFGYAVLSILSAAKFSGRLAGHPAARRLASAVLDVGLALTG
jgi:hypothetical protein